MDIFNFKITVIKKEIKSFRVIKFLSPHILIKKSQRCYAKSLLSKRETEILSFVVEGKSNTEIAKILNISKYTVKAHISNIFDKLCVNGRIQAAVKATKENII